MYTVNTSYKDVTRRFEAESFDKQYKNPLNKTFQYEYALYRSVADLFEKVVCKSKNVESLGLYFSELPRGSVKSGDESAKPKDESANETGSKKKTQEKILSEVADLVSRDVIDHINFPMMHRCAAYAYTVPEKDGSHSFIFSDGIYGFSVHMDVPKKGHPKRIEVTSPVACK